MPTATQPGDSSGRRTPEPKSTEDTGLSRLLAGSAVYTFAFAVQRAISLAMLPLYTKVLSPAEYGALGVLLSLYAAVNVVFSAGLEAAVIRNYFQLASHPEQRQQFVDSVWRFLVFYPVGASVLLGGVALLFVDGRAYFGAPEIAVLLLGAAVNTAATTVPLSLLRSRQDLKGYLWISLISSVTIPLFTALFVVVLTEGILGWFVAGLLSSVATLVAAMVVVPWHPSGTVRWSFLRTALVFSLPLVPHLLAQWALQLADRLVVAGLVTPAKLGTYTLAAVLATPVMWVIYALNQGFAPAYGRAGADPSQVDALKRTVTVQLVAVVGLTLAGMLLGPPLVELLSAPAYHDAAGLVPLIVLGYGFLGLYFVPMNGATLGSGRSGFAWVATALSAGVNLGLVVVLVPRVGLIGASAASALGYLTLVVLIGAWAHRRPNPVRYDWRRLAVALGVGALAYTGEALTAPDSPLVAVLAQLGWILLFSLAVVALAWPRQVSARLRTALAQNA